MTRGHDRLGQLEVMIGFGEDEKVVGVRGEVDPMFTTEASLLLRRFSRETNQSLREWAGYITASIRRIPTFLVPGQEDGPWLAR